MAQRPRVLNADAASLAAARAMAWGAPNVVRLFASIPEHIDLGPGPSLRQDCMAKRQSTRIVAASSCTTGKYGDKALVGGCGSGNMAVRATVTRSAEMQDT
eukprot:scaffold181341_cov25-Tisochrysis_lutea.AAC.1